MQRTEVYIATCAFNVGHIKEIKMFYKSKPYFYFPFLSKWSDGKYHMEEKRGMMPMTTYK